MRWSIAKLEVVVFCSSSDFFTRPCSSELRMRGLLLGTFSACLLLALLVPDVGGIFFPKPKERVRTVRRYVFVPVPVISHNTV